MGKQSRDDLNPCRNVAHDDVKRSMLCSKLGKDDVLSFEPIEPDQDAVCLGKQCVTVDNLRRYQDSLRNDPIRKGSKFVYDKNGKVMKYNGAVKNLLAPNITISARKVNSVLSRWISRLFTKHWTTAILLRVHQSTRWRWLNPWTQWRIFIIKIKIILSCV